MTGRDRYTLTRSDGVRVEVLRHLTREAARRHLWRDHERGDVAWMAREVEGQGNGRYR